jgi:hypothetical protein
MDDAKDLLSEIVTHPGWKVLRRELQEQLILFQDDLLTPAASEFDLIKKEGITQSMRALKQFFSRVENVVDSYQKRRG